MIGRRLKYGSFKRAFITLLSITSIYLCANYFATKKTSHQSAASEKQNIIRETFQKSWSDYETYGWGFDEYYPIKKKGRNYLSKGIGWMIIDALDTMMIMRLDEQVKHARDWINSSLTWDQGDEEMNVFETTIRMLGGLLSAHHLSNDELYLEKAVDLGDRLLTAYNTTTGIPRANVNLKTRSSKKRTRSYMVSTSECGTVQMELRYLSYLTGDHRYWDAADQVTTMLLNDPSWSHIGLVPISFNLETGKYIGANIRLGSHGDSYYEYLLKQSLQLKDHVPIYREAYNIAVDGILNHLVNYTAHEHYAYIAELPKGLNKKQHPKMDHLVCFLSGTLMWGATNGTSLSVAREGTQWNEQQEQIVKLSEDLCRTCYEMYSSTATGLSPEIVYFATDSKDRDMYTFKQDRHNLMRPETVESLFILYRITGKEIYREWGWNIFQAFLKHARLPGRDAFTCLNNVETTGITNHRDRTESFWFAETLKYLYLLFEDDPNVLALTEYTFNTEAHPFPNIIPHKDGISSSKV
ncbi:mannosyl-oligosaccharide 1,2-alpha-mannosidase [Schizosaccharomyces cryophilus OY26]|uniref:alpha-1,2-Mannosidase n=1 Tax=Schizosaccharomyces cryophilus (strain OY26 / ATCC MYA-4695 / CBS 11777 / NBRC 106824 / NRRL Y48691) TaxID=653667 RepID=S9XE41_SCHCR|nr:mannosyl-oligosaccharide 1,2-alpha-mannosidase [Schizosaccharomyces cryophilus OY26]EPY52046.1 mannosyl-oligosaccharide 1,2-alpha-mannosidase [Schizosaccharomyces cryophilus OY26]